MTATDTTTQDDAGTSGDAQSSGSGSRFSLARLVVTPVMLVAATALLLWWVFSQELLARDRVLLNGETIVDLTIEHMQLTIVATIWVLLIAIPLGIVLTRPFARPTRPFFLGLANIGQSTPSFGVIVLVAVLTGQVGFRVAVLAFVIYAILPVLRNTMVGIEQVDDAVIDAARGMGLSNWQVLTRIELPLAVPVMLAGIRTALVIVVGTAALATFINGGGLGDLINNGISLASDPILYAGAGLTAIVALAVDWLGGLAETALRPKGL